MPPVGFFSSSAAALLVGAAVSAAVFLRAALSWVAFFVLLGSFLGYCSLKGFSVGLFRFSFPSTLVFGVCGVWVGGGGVMN